RKFGFGPDTEQILREEIAKPYAFREIWSIGKGRLDTQFRDKAYLAMALAAHAADLSALETFTDYTKYYRDIRIGRALGLGFRGTKDGYNLLGKLADDPIFTVHREAQNATMQILDAETFARHPVAALKLQSRQPLRPEYPPPGKYEFADRNPEPAALPGT